MKDHTGKFTRTLERVQAQLKSGVKRKKVDGKTTNEFIPLSDADVKRLNAEIQTLTARLEGRTKSSLKNKSKFVKQTKKDEKQVTNPWVIDIYTVTFGYRNQAAKKKARKSAGKRKKMKKVKTKALLRTVTSSPGLIQKYKDGKMGLSPKSHVFKMRNKEIQPTAL